ncbi:MAG: gamma-glutamyl-gamma-aminobutyrate hydrolase family protein [Pseudomonadota bacterium]|jgi:CTP synthase|uniref:glutamine amidotransferase-related protein n=2 Tax=Burkholderiales TaxID=80840 RepID=UPI0010F7F0C1|nr:gamma-glutamyl-gamma-aminobutyrate hydrolase family protein [Burkholderia sp. 4M9327F10]
MIELVVDDSDLPAHYGVQAARLAYALGLPLRHLPARFDERRYPDAVQHVTVDGELVPSGLLWADRLCVPESGAALEPATLIASGTHEDFVVPFHPANARALGPIERFVELAAAAHTPLRRHVVMHDRETDGVVAVASAGHGGPRALPLARQDRHGRWIDLTDDEAVPGEHGQSDNAHPEKRPLAIALIGREAEQRDVYPATLAALADAADAQCEPLLIGFVAAQDLDHENAAAVLAAYDGIVLPGGADMTRVAGQIAAATYAWHTRKPVVGLCLGMQSMATAIARLALQTREVGLMEAEPGIRIASFIPIHGATWGNNARPLAHRLGRQTIDIVPGSRLHAMLGDTHEILCNHRYRLNPELPGPLAAMGLTIVARDASAGIADAVEAYDHPFFIGMQGHPELSSSAGRAHPLLCAFIDAVRQYSR